MKLFAFLAGLLMAAFIAAIVSPVAAQTPGWIANPVYVVSSPNPSFRVTLIQSVVRQPVDRYHTLFGKGDSFVVDPGQLSTEARQLEMAGIVKIIPINETLSNQMNWDRVTGGTGNPALNHGDGGASASSSK